VTTVIVGAGTAGCALAARLSEEPDRHVVLIEAGVSGPEIPAELRDAASIRGAMPGHPANWSFLGQLTPELAYTVVRGKVVGGSSAINGGYFIRARRTDHDSWSDVGGRRWEYENALPVWRDLESDRDFAASDVHGGTGPVPVKRPEPGRLAQAFRGAAQSRGHRLEPDKNGEQPPGVGPVPSNIIDGVRVSAAMSYLAPHRGSARLNLMPRTTVGRIVFEGSRAVGVETSRGVIRGEEIVLAAGAIGSARILLASGIGMPEDLEKLGIRVRSGVPVGAAFSDHPDISLSWQPEGPLFDADERFAFPEALNIDSGEHPEGDLELLLSVKPLGYLLTGSLRLRDGMTAGLRHPVRSLRAVAGISGRRAAAQIAHRDDLPLIVGLQAPTGRGRLSLRDADPSAPPRIEYRYLEEESDLSRLGAGIREAVALVEHMGGRVTEIAAADLDSDVALNAWMRSHLGTAIHMCGTAPMGPVVDGAGRVHGIEGLRVADTSILPVVPARGPAASAVLVGEIIARAMRDDD
jgi:choline dehydrogenase|tara:strand:+ start:5607 stop:7172 length:1566 start_codon:yes stop_codon:yes gene_type:complete